ncbi:hypothetical protein L7F22_067019 [Adiantum nelumboides]|nr:hypothetical protein [Adiantum nelumboides]
MALCASTPSSFRLNPYAPYFVPVAFSAVEDFSAEWWHLVQNSPAFREYWLAERFDPEMQLACDLDTLDLLDLDSVFLGEEEHLPAANMDLKDFARPAGLKAESAVSKPGRRPFSPLPYLDKPLKLDCYEDFCIFLCAKSSVYFKALQGSIVQSCATSNCISNVPNFAFLSFKGKLDQFLCRLLVRIGSM